MGPTAALPTTARPARLIDRSKWKPDTDVNTSEWRAPQAIRNAVWSERIQPFTVGPNRCPPLINAVIVIRRLSVLDGTAVVSESACDQWRLIGERRRFDRRKLTHPLARCRRVGEGAGVRQPIDCLCLIGTNARSGQ